MTIIRKPLLIATILIQILVSTYFNYYSFFFINHFNEFLSTFVSLSSNIILALNISFTYLQLYLKKNVHVPSTRDENIPLNEIEENNNNFNADTQNVNNHSNSNGINWKNVTTNIYFIILQDTGVTFLIIVPSFTVPRDDIANAFVFLLFFVTRLSILLIFISSRTIIKIRGLLKCRTN